MRQILAIASSPSSSSSLIFATTVTNRSFIYSHRLNFIVIFIDNSTSDHQDLPSSSPTTSYTEVSNALISHNLQTHSFLKTNELTDLLRSITEDEKHRVDDVWFAASIGSHDTSEILVERAQRLNLMSMPSKIHEIGGVKAWDFEKVNRCSVVVWHWF